MKWYQARKCRNCPYAQFGTHTSMHDNCTLLAENFSLVKAGIAESPILSYFKISRLDTCHHTKKTFNRSIELRRQKNQRIY